MIFVCGCGHCGTTLTAIMLGAHPDIYAVNRETRIFLKNEDNDDDAIRKAYAKWQRKALEEGKRLVCEKTPPHLHHISRIHRIYPDAKVVISVRDPRDACLSLAARRNKMGPAVNRWTRDHEVIRERQQNDENVFVYRYEDLIEDPEKLLRSLCDYVEVEYSEQMLRFHEDDREWFNSKKREPTSGAVGKVGTHRNWQIHQPLMDRRGRWKTRLSAEDLALIESECANLMEYFDYPLSTEDQTA